MRKLVLKVANFSVIALVFIATLAIWAWLKAMNMQTEAIALFSIAAFMTFCVFAAMFLAVIELADNSSKLVQLMKHRQADPLAPSQEIASKSQV